MGRKKTGDHRTVSFRMSQSMFDLLADIALLKGGDITSVLNEVLTDAEVRLRAWRNERRTQLAREQRLDRFVAGYDYGTAAGTELEAHRRFLNAMRAKLGNMTDEEERAYFRSVDEAMERITDNKAMPDMGALMDMVMAVREARREVEAKAKEGPSNDRLPPGPSSAS